MGDFLIVLILLTTIAMDTFSGSSVGGINNKLDEWLYTRDGTMRSWSYSDVRKEVTITTSFVKQ